MVQLCSFHDSDGEVVVNGKCWRFEFSKRFGPLWVNKNRTEKKNQNPPKLVWRDFYKHWYSSMYGEPSWLKQERELEEGLATGTLICIGRNIFPKEMVEKYLRK